MKSIQRKSHQKSDKSDKTAQLYHLSKIGFIAGVFSGFFKLGWEIPFPPRTPDRETPPQILLEKLGINSAQWNYHFSEHTINYGNLLIHFGFSILAAIIYVIAVQFFPKLSKGYGTGAGIAAWIIFHQIVLPICLLTPAPWNLPLAEQSSEFFGHIFWMNIIEGIRRIGIARQTSRIAIS